MRVRSAGAPQPERISGVAAADPDQLTIDRGGRSAPQMQALEANDYTL
jgi:hypothetical protein